MPPEPVERVWRASTREHCSRGRYDAYKRVAIIWTYPNGQSSPEDVCQRVSYGWDGSWNPNYALHGYDAGRLTGAYYGPEDSAGNSCIAGTAPTRYQEWYEYWPDGQIMSRSLTMSRGGKTSTIAANYLYNNAGNISEAVYPLATPFTQSAPSLGTVYFNTSYDSMGRPVSMTDSNYGWNWAQGAQYDYASRLTSLQYMAGAPGGTPSYTTETMAYNTSGQMVSQNWSTPSSSLGPTGGLQYSYSAGRNNGQIAQTTDTLSGETIGYQYDALKRLTSAASTPIRRELARAMDAEFPI